MSVLQALQANKCRAWEAPRSASWRAGQGAASSPGTSRKPSRTTALCAPLRQQAHEPVAIHVPQQRVVRAALPAGRSGAERRVNGGTAEGAAGAPVGAAEDAHACWLPQLVHAAGLCNHGPLAGQRGPAATHQRRGRSGAASAAAPRGGAPRCCRCCLLPKASALRASSPPPGRGWEGPPAPGAALASTTLLLPPPSRAPGRAAFTDVRIMSLQARCTRPTPQKWRRFASSGPCETPPHAARPLTGRRLAHAACRSSQSDQGLAAAPQPPGRPARAARRRRRQLTGGWLLGPAPPRHCPPAGQSLCAGLLTCLSALHAVDLQPASELVWRRCARRSPPRLHKGLLPLLTHSTHKRCVLALLRCVPPPCRPAALAAAGSRCRRRAPPPPFADLLPSSSLLLGAVLNLRQQATHNKTYPASAAPEAPQGLRAHCGRPHRPPARRRRTLLTATCRPTTRACNQGPAAPRLHAVFDQPGGLGAQRGAVGAGVGLVGARRQLLRRRRRGAQRLGACSEQGAGRWWAAGRLSRERWELAAPWRNAPAPRCGAAPPSAPVRRSSAAGRPLHLAPPAAAACPWLWRRWPSQPALPAPRGLGWRRRAGPPGTACGAALPWLGGVNTVRQRWAKRCRRSKVAPGGGRYAVPPPRCTALPPTLCGTACSTGLSSQGQRVSHSQAWVMGACRAVQGGGQ